jgi:hypothetical protein
MKSQWPVFLPFHLPEFINSPPLFFLYSRLCLFTTSEAIYENPIYLRLIPVFLMFVETRTSAFIICYLSWYSFSLQTKPSVVNSCLFDVRGDMNIGVHHLLFILVLFFTANEAICENPIYLWLIPVFLMFVETRISALIICYLSWYSFSLQAMPSVKIQSICG